MRRASRSTLSFLLAGALAGLAGPFPSARHAAFAGEVRCGSVKVKEGGASDTVTIQGTVLDPAALLTNAPLEVRCGTFTQTIPATELRVTGGAIAFKAKRGASGVLSFSVSRKKGKFTLKIGRTDVGDLDAPLPVVVDVGAQRLSATYPLAAGRKDRRWSAGEPFLVPIAVRVLEVTYSGGNAVLTPAAGVTFDPESATPPDDFAVTDAETSVGDDGIIRATIEVTDPAVLERVDLGSILGPGSGVTPVPAGRITAGDDGESQVVALVQRRPETAVALSPGAPTSLSADGADGRPAGRLDVPAGAVASAVPGFRFTPLAFAAQLPVPLPAGYTPVAAAELSAGTAVTFTAGSGPRLTLGRPRWIDRDVLAESDVRLLALREGTWTELPGRGAYDADADTVGPDDGDPALVDGTGIAVWAVRAPGVVANLRLAPARKLVRGRVVGRDGKPLRGRAVLTRAGVMVTGSDGAFEVDRSALSADSIEVVQAIGDATSTTRVVSAAEASAGVEIRASEELGEVKFGLISGPALEAGGTDPVTGATVTIRLASAVRGLSLVDRGTPDVVIDDDFVVPDLSDLGVRTVRWFLTIPGDDVEFASAVTEPRISPTDLLLESQEAGRSPGEGAYTVRVAYDVAGLGEVNLYAGFRVTVDGITPGVSDVQLPAALEGTAARSVLSGTAGDYRSLVRATVGIPMTAVAVHPDGVRTDVRTYQFSTSVRQGFVFPAAEEPPLPPGVVQGSWVPRAPMGTARSRFGSAVLDGRIWVAGGSAADGSPLALVEVYDPRTDTWSAARPMAVPRSGCGLAAAGGRLYAIGGWDGTSLLRSVEVYDPATDTWSAGAPLLAAREDAKVAAYGGRIFAFSGTTARGVPGADPATSCEILDLAAGTWSVGPEMPAALTGGDAAVLGDRIHVRGDGGSGPPQVVLDPATALWTYGTTPDGGANPFPGFCAFRRELWIVDGNAGAGRVLSYDPETDTYGAHPASPRGRTFGAAEAVDGVLFTLGGIVGGTASATVDAYRPAWLRRADASTPREGAAAVGAAGRVYLAGGNVAASGDAQTVATVEVYDPARDVWAPRAPMLEPRESFGFVAVGDLLYAVGGRNGTGPLASVEVHDPISNTWTARAPLSTPRSGAAVVAVGGRIYAAGGGSATVEVYDPATNLWTVRNPMTSTRSATAGAATGSLVFVAGGSDGGSTLVSAEAFNPATNTWTARSAFPLGAGRESHGLVPLGTRILAVGGRDTARDAAYGGALRLVQSFEVAANRWVDAHALPRGVRAPAVAVADGRVYVIGGRGGRSGVDDHFEGNDTLRRIVLTFEQE